MERFRAPQKQTRTLLNLHRSVQSNPISPKQPALIPKAGLLFTGITTLVTAAVATVAIATDHDPSLTLYQQAKASASQHSTNSSSETTAESSVIIDGGQPAADPETSEALQPTDGSVHGTVTIGDEVMPAVEGTTQRTIIDDQGNTHTVTVTIDNQSASSTSSSTSTDIVINSDTSSSTDNTTRGSPRR